MPLKTYLSQNSMARVNLPVNILPAVCSNQTLHFIVPVSLELKPVTFLRIIPNGTCDKFVAFRISQPNTLITVVHAVDNNPLLDDDVYYLRDHARELNVRMYVKGELALTDTLRIFGANDDLIGISEYRVVDPQMRVKKAAHDVYDLRIYPYDSKLIKQAEIYALEPNNTRRAVEFRFVDDTHSEIQAFVSPKWTFSWTFLVQFHHVYGCTTQQLFFVHGSVNSNPRPAWLPPLSEKMECMQPNKIQRRVALPLEEFSSLAVWSDRGHELFASPITGGVDIEHAGLYTFQLNRTSPESAVYTYELKQPKYSATDFEMHVVTEPTCFDSADGELSFDIPQSIEDAELEIRVYGCKMQFPRETSLKNTNPLRPDISVCNNIHIAGFDDKFVLTNVPYLTALTVEFTINGYCRVAHTVSHALSRPYVIESLQVFPMGYVNATHFESKITAMTQQLLPLTWAFVGNAQLIDQTEPHETRVIYSGNNVTIIATARDSLAVCSSVATIQLPAVVPKNNNDAPVEKYPEIIIDRAASFAPFCVGEDDGVIYAKFVGNVAPYATRMKITWFKDKQIIAAAAGSMRLGAIFAPNSISVRTGIYTVMLTISEQTEPDRIAWTSSDSIRMQAKARYVLETHTSIDVVAGTATVDFARDARDVPEVDSFKSEMISSRDRADGLLPRNGVIHGLTPGRRLLVTIPRPKNHPIAEACKQPLIISMPHVLFDLPAVTDSNTGYTYKADARRPLTVASPVVKFGSDNNVSYESGNVTYNIKERKTSRRRGSNNDEHVALWIQSASDVSPAYEDTKKDGAIVKNVHSRNNKYIVYVRGISLPEMTNYELHVSDKKFVTIDPHVYDLYPSDDLYWPISRTVTLEHGRSYDISIKPKMATTSRASLSSNSLVIDTFDMTPVQVTCNIGLLPSSLYSYDGTLQITIHGGQPPYYILWADISAPVYFNNTPQHTNTYTYTRTQVGIGIYYATIIDSLFQVGTSSESIVTDNDAMKSCSFSVYASLDPTLRVSLLDTSVPSGCYAATRSLVTVALSTGGNAPIPIVTGIGAWEHTTQFPITSCSDARMRAVNASAPELSTYITVGEWRVALCLAGTTILATMDDAESYAILSNETTPLDVFNITVGQTCSTNVSNTVTKIPATFDIAMPFAEPLFLEFMGQPIPGSVTIFPALGKSNVVILGNLPSTGPSNMVVIYDARNCPYFATIAMVDTGLAQCGNCNISDFSCVDACGVPFGNNTCLYDCVIDDKVRDPYYIAFEIQLCVDNGTSIYATSSAPAIYFDLLFTNINRVNMTSFTWALGPNMYLAPNASSSACPNNNTYGNVWMYNFYLEIGGLNIVAPPCGLLILSMSNVTYQTFTQASRGGEPYLEIWTSTTSIVTFALYNTPDLPVLVIDGNGAVNFTFDVYSNIYLLVFVNYATTATNTNVSLICRYFQRYPTYIMYISVNGGEPIGVDYALAVFCVESGVSVHASLRKNIVVNAYIYVPAVFFVYFALFFVLVWLFGADGPLSEMQ